MNAPNHIGWVEVTQWLFSFALVIGLLLACLYALKHLQGQRLLGRKPSRIQILESRSIGPRQKLQIVAVDDQQLLIAVSPGHVQTLTVCAPPRAASALLEGRT